MNIFFINHLSLCRFPLLAPWLNLIAEFLLFNGKTELLAFPDSHALPQDMVFWIQVTLLTLTFYYSSGSWVALVAITSAQYLCFPHTGSLLSSLQRVRTTIHKYPCFVKCRASFRYFSAIASYYVCTELSNSCIYILRVKLLFLTFYKYYIKKFFKSQLKADSNWFCLFI